MKNQVVAIVLVFLVAGSLGVGYLAGSTASHTTTSTEAVPFSEACSHLPTPTTNATSLFLIDVMLIPPDSTGFVCLSYGQVSHNASDLQQAIQLVQGTIWSGGQFFALPLSANPSYATGVSVTAISSSISQDNETIEYQIQTSGNSTGAYTWAAPGGCPGLPLVVGSSVTASEKSALEQFYSGKFGCESSPLVRQLAGVSGITLPNL